LPAATQAPVAIVYDYEAHWITHIQPQARDFHYYELVFRWYEAIRRGGLDVDFVRPGASLTGYKLVLVPTMPHINAAAEKALTDFDGITLFGPRTGSKTRHFAIPQNLPPGPLSALLDMRVIEVSSMRPSLSIAVAGEVAGKAVKWAEHIETKSNILATFENGTPALIANNKHHYLACWPNEALLTSVIARLCADAGLKRKELPPHIRLRKRGDVTFAFNYGPESFALDARKTYLLGDAELGAYQVAAWRT
jgi:beta-galactosidase